MGTIRSVSPPITTPQKDHESALKCLRSVACHHGKIISLQTLRSKDKSGKASASLRSIAEIGKNAQRAVAEVLFMVAPGFIRSYSYSTTLRLGDLFPLIPKK